MEGENNPFGIISIVTGVLALLGQGCCCVPLISILALLAYPLTIILFITSVATGIVGIMRARSSGESVALPAAGLAINGVTFLLFVLLLLIQGASFGIQMLAAIFGN